MTLWDNLPHRCTIRRRTTSRGSGVGGTKTGYVEERFQVPCWEQNASHAEIERFEKLSMAISRKVYFKADPGVDERYEIVITSRDYGETNIAVADRLVLEVRSESIPDTTAGLGVGYKVMVEEVTGENQ